MKNIVKKLGERKGSSYIDVIIGFFVAVMVIAMIMQFIPVIILKTELNNLASAASRIISIEGQYNTEVQNKIEAYRISHDMEEVTIALTDTEFIPSTDKIQLNDLIVVNIQASCDLGFFTFGSFPVTLHNKAEARSEVYWK
jgi:hypothetical protein